MLYGMKLSRLSQAAGVKDCWNYMAKATVRFTKEKALDIVPKLALRRICRDGRRSAPSCNVQMMGWKEMLSMAEVEIQRIVATPEHTNDEKAQY